MVKTIYKYSIPLIDKPVINLPAGALILSVGNQREALCVWVLLDQPASAFQVRSFRVVGTGHDVQDLDEFVFLDTVQFRGGELIFHIFVEKDPT
jgi:hypothetical protein